MEEFKENNEIESKEYHAENDTLYIVPTDTDIEKFGKMLCKDIGNGLRAFKKTSKINKD